MYIHIYVYEYLYVYVQKERENENATRIVKYLLCHKVVPSTTYLRKTDMVPSLIGRQQQASKK
jgi:hypothetical protein